MNSTEYKNVIQPSIWIIRKEPPKFNLYIIIHESSLCNNWKLNHIIRSFNCQNIFLHKSKRLSFYTYAEANNLILIVIESA
jgi:hypothetical protein